MTGWLAGVPAVPAHPANYAKGRQGYRPLWFVVHCTDTEYADNYPANLGKYWQRTQPQVSVHFSVSDTMTRQFVSCDDTAYQARNPGNLRGIGVEIVGRAAWTRNEWLAHKRMLRNAAQLCADVTRVYGLKTSPALLSATALKARNSGLTHHGALSAAFQGTHTDPGGSFPWDFFASELRIALGGIDDERARVAANQVATPPAAASDEGDFMALSDAEQKALLEGVQRLNKQMDRIDDVVGGAGKAYEGSNLAKQLGYLITVLGGKIDVLTRKFDAAMQGIDDEPPAGPKPTLPTQTPPAQTPPTSG